VLASASAGRRPAQTSDPFLGMNQPTLEDGVEAARRARDIVGRQEVPDVVESIVKDLVRVGVVAICSGNMEAGPRALGNRSILADPRSRTMADTLNRCKKREWFQPFGASIDPTRLADVAAVAPPSPFMNFSTLSRAAFRTEAPAVIHRNGRVRYHTPNSESILLRKILRRWLEVTDCPALLNTSLNPPGEPICRTASDAVDATIACGLPILYVNQVRLAW
jgi:carbamoyltransferase